jgi:hypothetical protein
LKVLERSVRAYVALADPLFACCAGAVRLADEATVDEIKPRRVRQLSLKL